MVLKVIQQSLRARTVLSLWSKQVLPFGRALPPGYATVREIVALLVRSLSDRLPPNHAEEVDHRERCPPLRRKTTKLEQLAHLLAYWDRIGGSVAYCVFSSFRGIQKDGDFTHNWLLGRGDIVGVCFPIVLLVYSFTPRKDDMTCRTMHCVLSLTDWAQLG